MKIGFDAKRLFNNFTGLGNHSRNTIDILTEYYPSERCLLYTPKVTCNPTTTPYLELANCEMRTPTGMLHGSMWRTFGISREARRDGIDVFHGLSNELPVGLDVPKVVTIHDVAFRRFTDMYHWQDRQIYDMKWKHACRSSQRIIAISECTRRDIIEYYDVDPGKIDVVYQPVDRRYYESMERRRMAVVPAAPYMLYVGSINSRKNLLGAIRAIEMLPSDLQMPLMVVGGGGDYRRRVEAYVAEHGLSRLVIFPGRRITDGELQQLYLHAELFVYPSFYEGFGLPVVEALLCRCPVVTSNVSSLPEAGGPMSLYADPGDADDIAEKMRTALTDSTLRSAMRASGYDYAMAEFHPKVSADRLMTIYNKV